MKKIFIKRFGASFPRIYGKLKGYLSGIFTILLRLRGLKLPAYFDLHARWVVLFRGIEHDVFRVSERLLKPGMVVLDVGANVGLLARHFAKLVGKNGKVIAFEPDPDTRAALVFNMGKFSTVEVRDEALTDSNGPVTLHLNPDSGTGNSLVNVAAGGRSIEVPGLTMDAFLATRPELLVDVVKIDVEGGEIHVLRGMRETVRRLPGLRLIVEFCPKNLGPTQEAARALFDELCVLGFGLAWLAEDGSEVEVESFESLCAALPAVGYVNLLCTAHA
jgi:FkbM family methyltransferase